MMITLVKWQTDILANPKEKERKEKGKPITWGQIKTSDKRELASLFILKYLIT